MNWLYYLLEANLYLAIFYALYLLLLRNETFYTANRWYLISTSVIAFLLPFMQIGWLKPAETAAQVVSVAATQTVVPATNFQQVDPVSNPVAINLADVLSGIYVLGVAIALVLFGVKIFKLYRIISNSKKTNSVHCDLIELEDENTGFSFFSYLFIGKNLHNRHTIIAHEMVHIRQKHSADIVFTELLKMVNWFNPVVYMLQNSLKTVHEYIADEYTATSETDNITYSSFLLNSAYGLQGPAATNSFFNANLLKNRIVMLNKPRSGSAARLKYLMAIPITAGTLCLSTLSFSKDYPTFDLYSGGEATKAEINLLTTELHKADTGLRIPAPTVVKNDFTALTTYLGKHIRFPASEINKTKFAGLSVSFDVDKSGEVGDVRLLAPAKNVFGNAAVSAFHKFSSKLKVEPGTYIIGVNFVALAKNYVRFPEPSVTKNANFISTVTILGTDKQQKQKLKEQSISAIKRSNPSVQIPEPKIERISFKNIDNADIKAFNIHLSRYVRYPKADFDNKITGRVFAQIITNEDFSIKDVKVLRAPSKTLEDEVVRAIKLYKGKLPPTKSDHVEYTIPVSFRLEDKYGKILSEEAVSLNNNENKNPQKETPKNNNVVGKGKYMMLNEIVITGFLPKS